MLLHFGGEDGALDRLAVLRANGAVAEIGLGMNDPASALRLLREWPRVSSASPLAGQNDVAVGAATILEGANTTPAALATDGLEWGLDSVMLAGCWNLLNQSGVEVLQECERRRVVVHNAGIFASGLLAGGATVGYRPATGPEVARADEWRQLAAAHGVGLPAVALAFAWLPCKVSRVAVGVKSAGEVREILVAAASLPLPRGLWAEAVHRGLLPKGLLADL